MIFKIFILFVYLNITYLGICAFNSVVFVFSHSLVQIGYLVNICFIYFFLLVLTQGFFSLIFRKSLGKARKREREGGEGGRERQREGVGGERERGGSERGRTERERTERERERTERERTKRDTSNLQSRCIPLAGNQTFYPVALRPML